MLNAQQASVSTFQTNFVFCSNNPFSSPPPTRVAFRFSLPQAFVIAAAELLIALLCCAAVLIASPCAGWVLVSVACWS